jgi:hypothetical protein
MLLWFGSIAAAIDGLTLTEIFEKASPLHLTGNAYCLLSALVLYAGAVAGYPFFFLVLLIQSITNRTRKMYMINCMTLF